MQSERSRLLDSCKCDRRRPDDLLPAAAQGDCCCRERDVSGIDVNMGCPKDFSLKGGMGAALLTQPDKVRSLLSTLVEGLSIPVTCKIRLLPNLEDTLSLVKVIESTGVAAIAVHGRTKAERPRDRNNDAAIKRIVDVVRVPVIANGGSEDVRCYADIEAFRAKTGAASVMLARASESNPSIFRPQGLLPLTDVIRRFLRHCILYDNHLANVKYVVQHMMSSLQASDEGQRLLAATDVSHVYAIWNMDGFAAEIKGRREHEKRFKSSGYSLREERSVKRFKSGDGHGGDCQTSERMNEAANGKDDRSDQRTESTDMVMEDCIRFQKGIFRPETMPKQLLNNYCAARLDARPEYRTMCLERKFHAEVSVQGRLFRSTFLEKNKRNAEQAAALIACLHYQLLDRSAVADCLLDHDS